MYNMALMADAVKSGVSGYECIVTPLLLLLLNDDDSVFMPRIHFQLATSHIRQLATGPYWLPG